MSDRELTDAQHGTGDMGPEEFRRAAVDVAGRVADYLERLEDHAVLPDIRPGEIKARIGSDRNVQAGETVGLEFKSTAITLFDENSGRALRSALGTKCMSAKNLRFSATVKSAYMLYCCGM